MERWVCPLCSRRRARRPSARAAEAQGTHPHADGCAARALLPSLPSKRTRGSWGAAADAAKPNV